MIRYSCINVKLWNALFCWSAHNWFALLNIEVSSINTIWFEFHCNDTMCGSVYKICFHLRHCLLIFSHSQVHIHNTGGITVAVYKETPQQWPPSVSPTINSCWQFRGNIILASVVTKSSGYRTVSSNRIFLTYLQSSADTKYQLDGCLCDCRHVVLLLFLLVLVLAEVSPRKN